MAQQLAQESPGLGESAWIAFAVLGFGRKKSSVFTDQCKLMAFNRFEHLKQALKSICVTEVWTIHWLA